MKAIMLLNLFCIIWMSICFFFNWEPWMQVAILAPNMFGWTLVSWEN